MIDNLTYIIQNTTVEQLKTEIDKNAFIDINLKKFNEGKEIIDKLFELNKTKLNDSVKYALLLYSMYKIKGGK